jgi:hypothetical protein
MNNRMILRPPFSTQAAKSDDSAGTADISNVEALIIAAWRENRFDTIVTILNIKMHGGLQIRFYDPLCDGDLNE